MKLKLGWGIFCLPVNSTKQQAVFRQVLFFVVVKPALHRSIWNWNYPRQEMQFKLELTRYGSTAVQIKISSRWQVNAVPEKGDV
ncbi:MAG: hypothetical protein OEV26_02460 [Gallionella sp.]|nr:hypothetical protein [Gallionella sp.]